MTDSNITHFLKYLLAVVAGMGTVLAGDRQHSPIPLEKGTQWRYEAEIQWTPVGVGGVRSNHLRWTMEVLERLDSPTATVAVVRGYPDEIAGMDPAVPKGFSVLVEASNRLYRLSTQLKSEAMALARQLAGAPLKLPDSAEVLLDLPLTVDKRWGGDAQDRAREDGYYCWHVEEPKREVLSVKGVPTVSSSTLLQVAYRTLPDHQLIELVADVGIVRFEYEHHGTIASAKVRLVEFIRGTTKK